MNKRITRTAELFIGIVFFLTTLALLAVIALWPISLGGWWLLALFITVPLAISIAVVMFEWLDERYG